jgi:hypothetical protein
MSEPQLRLSTVHAYFSRLRKSPEAHALYLSGSILALVPLEGSRFDSLEASQSLKIGVYDDRTSYEWMLEDLESAGVKLM